MISLIISSTTDPRGISFEREIVV